MVEFKVLGPLQVSVGGQPVAIGSARKRRVVLATLLARAGQPVSVDTLIATVWGEHAPSSARSNVQLYVHQLRRALGGDQILAAGDAYAIHAGDRLDAVDFRRRAVEGGAALDADDPVDAEITLHAALDLWRGKAFAEFLDCEVVAEEAQRLELLRLEVCERWAEAKLVTGPTGGLIAELTGLCRLNPYREGLRAQLMRALYVTGRQAEALAVFQETRALFVDELGVEPGPSLQRLHAAMLRGDEAIVSAPSFAAPSTRPSTVPRELPPDPPLFVGREQVVRLLDASLPAGDRSARPTLICGMGGVGKTTLAVHWAHRVKDHFPDGQLYVNLRGYAAGASMRSVDALGLLLRALGVPPARVPMDLDAAVGMYRTLLTGRLMLLLLDNARDPGQVRPLLPSAPGCLALVTSRDRLTGLVAREGACRIIVDVLTASEATGLVGRLLGSTDPEDAASLARACDRLPLAIRIASAHLADRPGLAITDYVRALRSSLDGLEVGGDPEASVRSTFAHSYHALAPPAQRLLRLLGLVPGPDVAPLAVAALADITLDDSQRLIDLLVHAHLLEPVQTGRYAMHDLLRVYAAEQARAADEAERKDASARLHDFYLSATDAVARMLHPRGARPPIDVPAGFPYRTSFPDLAAATAWVDAELGNLVALVEHTATGGPHRVAWLLANALGVYFWLRARHNTQWLTTLEAGLAAATADGDLSGLASARLGLAVAHRVLGRPADTIGYARTALRLSRQLGWRHGEVAALSNLGAAHAELGQNHPALAAFDQSRTVSREVMGRAGEAGPLANRSELRFRMGQLREALRDALAALEIYQELGDTLGQARGQLSAAQSYGYLGTLDRAHHHLTESLRLFEKVGERYSLILTRCLLTRLLIDAGRHKTAAECATAVLRDALQAKYDEGAAVSLVALVEARRNLGQRADAVRDCAQAVQLARRANHRIAEAAVLVGLAEAYRYDGKLERALATLAAARRIAGRYGFRLVDGLALTTLGEVRLAGGDRTAAAEHGVTALAIHRETGYRVGEARCRLLLSEALPDPIAAQEHQRAAHAILEDLSNSPFRDGG